MRENESDLNGEGGGLKISKVGGEEGQQQR